MSVFTDWEAYRSGLSAGVRGDALEGNPFDGFSMKGSFFSWRSWKMGWRHGTIDAAKEQHRQAIAD